MKQLKDILEGIFDIEDNVENIDRTIKDNIKKFLKENYRGISKCKISRKPNNNGKYEVSSSFNIEVKNYKIKSLTNELFVWAEVGGDFSCRNCCSLTSLKGAPKEVGGHFDCGCCISLKTLEGAPEKVGGSFYCHYCNALTSLEGAPEKIGKNFKCHHCKSLTSLEGGPNEVGENFDCEASISLTSLEGAPEKVGGYFKCLWCGKQFTTDDVKAVCNVKGEIIYNYETVERYM